MSISETIARPSVSSMGSSSLKPGIDASLAMLTDTVSGVSAILSIYTATISPWAKRMICPLCASAVHEPIGLAVSLGLYCTVAPAGNVNEYQPVSVALKK